MTNIIAYNIPFASIFMLMIAAVITPLLPDRNRIPEKLSCWVIAAAAVLSACLLYALAHNSQALTFSFPMGRFPAPWGNELRAGPLEAVMAMVFCTVMLLSILGNFSSTEEDVSLGRRKIFCVLINLLTASLLVLAYTNDIFTGYIFIELIAAASCGVVAVKEEAESIRAALRYLVMSLIGSGLILIAVCVLYGLTGQLSMPNMHNAIQVIMVTKDYMIPLTVSLALITSGLAVKSALYPFAFWLPDAHGNSTNVSSAVLSGLVLKGHIFLLIKIYCRIFGLDVIHALRMDTVIFIFGVLGMIMGSVHALRQTNVKKMIAWSSVAQVGYIFLGLGLNTEAGIAAACLHIIVHASIKPMLITSAGGLSTAAGHRKGLHALMGTFYANRWAGLGMIAGACSMMGVPAFAGFSSKMSLILASFDSPFVIFSLAVLAASSVLNALYYVPAVIVILTHREKIIADKSSPTRLYKISMSIFLALNFYLGLFFMPLLRLITRGVKVL